MKNGECPRNATVKLGMWLAKRWEVRVPVGVKCEKLKVGLPNERWPNSRNGLLPGQLPRLAGVLREFEIGNVEAVNVCVRWETCVQAKGL